MATILCQTSLQQSEFMMTFEMMVDTSLHWDHTKLHWFATLGNQGTICASMIINQCFQCPEHHQWSQHFLSMKAALIFEPVEPSLIQVLFWIEGKARCIMWTYWKRPNRMCKVILLHLLKPEEIGLKFCIMTWTKFC